MNGTSSAALEDLLAKQEIYEVVCRYARGIDRLDMDLVRSCYHPDAIDHHTGFSGGVEEFLTWAEGALRQMSGTMHTLCNHLVELHGDVAVAETYAHTTHWTREPTKPSHNAVTGTRYIDRFEKRNGEWRIAERWATRSWIRTEQDGMQITDDPSNGPVGRRDAQDPLHAALG
ncbi:nuclear transport factor 2 family protein [Nocardioides sp. zg-ZUI104]|uniref:nuclear transport factor 2 family protein n=1 Tax=Nocardioides faecalis TaxID=2803858 RepID=UPI001BCDD4F3|nr:nuclear transport factor 2 family protein [Nocardioides faecalis]MBS4754558.1 nuclear transport factor 2 family protein [Nocardioides faecalis]